MCVDEENKPVKVPRCAVTGPLSGPITLWVFASRNMIWNMEEQVVRSATGRDEMSSSPYCELRTWRPCQFTATHPQPPTQLRPPISLRLVPVVSCSHSDFSICPSICFHVSHFVWAFSPPLTLPFPFFPIIPASIVAFPGLCVATSLTGESSFFRCSVSSDISVREMMRSSHLGYSWPFFVPPSIHTHSHTDTHTLRAPGCHGNLMIRSYDWIA